MRAQRDYCVRLVPGPADTRVKTDPSPRLMKDVEDHCDVLMNTHIYIHIYLLLVHTFTCTFTDTCTNTLRHILIHTCTYNTFTHTHVFKYILMCTHAHKMHTH